MKILWGCLSLGYNFYINHKNHIYKLFSCKNFIYKGILGQGYYESDDLQGSNQPQNKKSHHYFLFKLKDSDLCCG